MKRETPTERDLANLIATAFEQLPEPDARRLAAIEQQLLEQPRLRRRTKFAWWWLVGALVAGAASALWWAVEYDSDQAKERSGSTVTSPSMVPSSADPSTRPGKSEDAGPTSAGMAIPKQGPTIYQREK